MTSNEWVIDFESGSPWWPGLAEHLAAEKWSSLREDFELSEGAYSTGFFLRDPAAAEHRIVDQCSLGGAGRVSFEFLSEFSQQLLSQHELFFYSKEEFYGKNLNAAVLAGLKNIALVGTLHDSVANLAKRIVLLKPRDDYSDTSYSSPIIPFTIFVSVPGSEVENIGLRVAESIIHECMHLQLTLLEHQVPLVSGRKDDRYSPWKTSMRSATGVLHALYVFTVIREWIHALPLNVQCEYLKRRSEQIAAEIAQIRAIADSHGLTDQGRRVAKYLLGYLPTDGAI